MFQAKQKSSFVEALIEEDDSNAEWDAVLSPVSMVEKDLTKEEEMMLADTFINGGSEDNEEDVFALDNEPKKEQKKITKGGKRAMYETQDDLDKEDLFREELQNTFKCSLDKMPISYGLDFLMTKGDKAVGVMEVKHRDIDHAYYDTIMLSLLKWNKGIAFSHQNNLTFSFAVRFKDGDYRYVYNGDDLFHIEFGGRTKQTRDSADIEPVVLIPVSKFQKIPTKKL